RNVPDLESRVQFVMRMPAAEMHVLVRNAVRSIEDLRGKRVHFGNSGSTASVTGPLVFQRLGIAVRPIVDDFPVTPDRLISGEQEFPSMLSCQAGPPAAPDPVPSILFRQLLLRRAQLPAMLK